MEHQEENEAIVEPDEDGGWVDTHHHVDPSGEQAVTGAQESFAEMTLESDKVFACLSGGFIKGLAPCNLTSCKDDFAHLVC